jgi:hypothetical protein
MNRRDFLKFSSCGLTFVAVGSTMPLLMQGNSAFAQTSSSRLDLDMVDVLAEMVDKVQVPMWAFKISDSSALGSDDLKGQARIPGPALFAIEGETIRMRIRNRIENNQKHAFAIPGVVRTEGLGFDERQEIEFTAPKAGTYLYYDPINAPVNRVMGLHGVLVVLPNPVGTNRTPYSDPTANIQALFNDLGNPAKEFPGHPWDPARNAIWVFNTVDPVKNGLAAGSGSGSGLGASTFLDGYLPQYFTINGKSGYFSAQHHHASDDEEGGGHAHAADRFDFDLQANISIRGRVGQPMLIRNVNAGLMWHSPHIHGNHVYELAENGTLRNNLFMLDTWAIPPLHRKELLLPFIMPPDIPAEHEVVSLAGEGTGRLAWPPLDEKFPLLYPMHDHNEISNTAAGGNYPHGLATHWQFDGDIDPLAAVIQVEKAEYRVRGGQLLLEGRSSTPGIHLEFHAGSDTDSIGQAHVHGNGRWSFRGRSLRALAQRTVTIVFHDMQDPTVIHASRTVPLTFR